MIFGMIKDTVTVKSTGNRENERKSTRMKTAQFAGLHGVNKRMLHYYDSIGLFPRRKRGKITTVITERLRAWILSISAC